MHIRQNDYKTIFYDYLIICLLVLREIHIICTIESFKLHLSNLRQPYINVCMTLLDLDHQKNFIGSQI